MPVGSNLNHNPEINHNMASYKRNKSGGTQTEGPSNSASPASSIALSNPSSTQGINNNAPKYGTLVPNRIFVGGISSNTTETELCQLFSKYGNVKATKIIADRAGVSKGYGFVTFDTEDEVRSLIQDSNNIVLKERRLNIAPAIKKQPSFSRTFDASSPPPATPNLYFHNGVPYTFHNGMAFFPPTPHQPTITTLPHSTESPIYQSYGPAQNTTPAPYGTPVLVPAHPPMFMPQNYSYQPLPIANGATTQYIYTGSGSANGNSGSPLAGTPDNTYMSTPLTSQFFTQQYPPPEAFYPQSMFVYPYNGDYEALDQQTIEGRSSTATTPQSDSSDRSSNQSPGNMQANAQVGKIIKECHSRGQSVSPNTDQTETKPIQQASIDSQVPVVSWKNQAEERELYIRDGRRAFYPAPPPPPTPPSRGNPSVLLYHHTTFQGSYPAHIYSTPKQNQVSKEYYGQRQNNRGRQRPTNTMPFIPKFPASFNNNNPLALNNNYHDNKMGDVSNGRPQKYMNNRFRGGTNRGNHESPPPSNPSKSTNPESFPSPQIVQQPQNHHYERSSGIRWTAHQQIMSKRMPFNRRQNGSTQNVAMTANANTVRLAKKPQSDVESDLGGGGDAQPIMDLALTPPGSPTANSDATSKMQSLSLGTNS